MVRRLGSCARSPWFEYNVEVEGFADGRLAQLRRGGEAGAHAKAEAAILGPLHILDLQIALLLTDMAWLHALLLIPATKVFPFVDLIPVEAKGGK